MKTYKFKIGNNPYTVEIASMEGGVAKVNVNGIDYEVEIEDAPTSAAAAPVASVAGTASAASAASAAGTVSAAVSSAPAAATPAAAPAGPAKKVCSPLPGVILSVNVAVGDKVKAGDKVAVLEAMKMENDIEAEFDGTITAIHVQKGDSVLEGAAIVSLA
ncbi:MAG: biotin/lipoyl-binding protein [Bacteroidales bacterium]|nr:biotin/lipoyl-binding protein [Bacteroidales bacterium]MBQ9597973.1 biotin/lipoyl-binding protein [Bacteroidales bacterium]